MAEVKLTLGATEYQLLQSLLRYWAGTISADQLTAILTSYGYKVAALDAQVQYIAEQLAAAIK